MSDFTWLPANRATIEDVEAVVVDMQNQVHVSSGLKDRLILIAKPTDGI